MGNCLALQNKVIRVMKTDGNVVEYRAPLRVHEVLSEFPGHAISHTLKASKCLDPHTNMHTGHLYHLRRSPTPSSIDNTAFVRVKVVITKQELKEMLAKGGLLVDEKMFQIENRESRGGIVIDDHGDDDVFERCKAWKPVLQSIPE
ncbi:hypothetical protein Scep_003331 [Stephania cephalantha]|uniref:Uncharacterized protein n=1 Tax=Stephania cephalantha TaxID=152367 RepID=A0AAP0PUA8_9MAGN